MLNASILALPDLPDSGAAESAYALGTPSVNRSPRVGGVHGCGQPLRGTWRPMLLQPPAASRPVAPLRIFKASEAPQAALGWWRSLLQRIGIVAAAAPAPPAPQFQQLYSEEAAVEIAPTQGLHVSDEDGADAAASFWEEHMISPDETVQVYGSPEIHAVATDEQTRIGRSFLGAYRKGRRAAEAGLTAKHCPYQARLEKEGRPVNALTRTFQRYWAEGLEDVLAGQPERYV
jgi:hypothetical protein